MQSELTAHPPSLLGSGVGGTEGCLTQRNTEPRLRQNRSGKGVAPEVGPGNQRCGAPRGSTLPPAHCRQRVSHGVPQPGLWEPPREAGLTPVPRAGRDPEKVSSASPGPHRGAETRRGRRKQKERRPRKQRSASPEGPAEALTHLRRGYPPSVQQPRRRRRQQQRREGRGRLCGRAGALRMPGLRRRVGLARHGNYQDGG